MAPSAKNGNGWKLYLIIGVAMAYFGWMGTAIVSLGREASAMKAEIASLTDTRTREATPPPDTPTEFNTRRIDQIDGRPKQ